MSTRRETIQYILGQLEPLNVRARAMFGEYCLWCDEKPVALVCDETLFLKPTPVSEGKGMDEAEAYQGSRLFRIVGPDLIEDSEKLRFLIQATADALPPPKPKHRRLPRPR